MSDPRITIRLSPNYAKLLWQNIDGWLDAGACDDGLQPEERKALHSAAGQLVKQLLKIGLIGRKQP